MCKPLTSAGLSGLEITEAYDAVAVHFSTPISAEQSLEVALTVLCPQEPGDRFYRVDSWKAVATGEWQPDDTLNLFDGNFQ